MSRETRLGSALGLLGIAAAILFPSGALWARDWLSASGLASSAARILGWRRRTLFSASFVGPLRGKRLPTASPRNLKNDPRYDPSRPVVRPTMLTTPSGD